jgi:hypothetical protein
LRLGAQVVLAAPFAFHQGLKERAVAHVGHVRLGAAGQPFAGQFQRGDPGPPRQGRLIQACAGAAHQQQQGRRHLIPHDDRGDQEVRLGDRRCRRCGEKAGLIQRPFLDERFGSLDAAGQAGRRREAGEDPRGARGPRLPQERARVGAGREGGADMGQVGGRGGLGQGSGMAGQPRQGIGDGVPGSPGARQFGQVDLQIVEGGGAGVQFVAALMDQCGHGPFHIGQVARSRQDDQRQPGGIGGPGRGGGRLGL